MTSWTFSLGAMSTEIAPRAIISNQVIPIWQLHFQVCQIKQWIILLNLFKDNNKDIFVETRNQRIGTSQLICCADQIAGFYKIDVVLLSLVLPLNGFITLIQCDYLQIYAFLFVKLWSEETIWQNFHGQLYHK